MKRASKIMDEIREKYIKAETHATVPGPAVADSTDSMEIDPMNELDALEVATPEPKRARNAATTPANTKARSKVS